MFLLATNVVSELRRHRPHLHLATVTLGEIQAGIELTREQDPGKARDLETWLDQVSQSFNILSMDGPAFRCWARLMHRRSDTLYEDAMIAAIARVHQLTVVTRNIRDFQDFGVELLNPFEAGLLS
jgi:predicted nucleic acid-binding protein